MYAAVGVGVAYVLAFTLLPSVMVLAPPPAISKRGTGVFWNGALVAAVAVDAAEQGDVGRGLGGHRRRFCRLGKRVARGQQID